MKRVLIVCAHRPGRSPSQRYRFEQYLPYLSAAGYSFTWSPLLSEKEDCVFYSAGNLVAKLWILFMTVLRRIRDCYRFGKFDIVFIQREVSFLGTSFAEKRAFQSGARVIFDFDDSIWLADTSPGNKRWEWVKKPEKLFDNIKLAHRVIAGNPFLASVALKYNPEVMVIPTTVDTDVHFPMPELRGKGEVNLGWSGSVSTIKHFEALIPVLKRIYTRYGDMVTFTLLGDPQFRSNEIPVSAIAWSAETEVQELNKFDIGLMPLPDDEWSKGKCGLKALTYMACGVVTVASRVGVNAEIINGENGFLVTTEEDWFNTLCRLIENKGAREIAGKLGRETVVRNYSVIANREKYLRAFSF